MSKGLPDIITLLKDEEQPSQLLITALSSGTGKDTLKATMAERSKLTDLVVPKLTKEGETEMQQDGRLLKPLSKPSKPLLKPWACSHTHFDETKIKTGVAIQWEQQWQRAERLLEQDAEPELIVEEMENIARKEEVRLGRAEWHEWRMKEKEEKEGENVRKDLAVQEGETSSVRSSGSTERLKTAKPKKPCGKKNKIEEQMTGEVKEEKYEEEVVEAMMKRKAVGCINKEEAAGFQNFLRDKMIVLVERMRNDKNLIQPVQELICSLKLKYDKMGLFENNGVADVEEIVKTIYDSKGTAWRKYLEGKEILDAEDYDTIVELTIRSRLFQEGSLHDKINEQVLIQEMEDTKAEIMKRCRTLFSNVAKVYKVNLAIMTDLKELSTLIKEPEVFSQIAQAATQLLMACYTPRIDKFIAQRQVVIDAEQGKQSQRKSVVELMEMSSLQQYTESWGEKTNKEKGPTCYMVAIIYFILKWEMTGMAPNISNLVDVFRVSRSQLSQLVTAKKFQSQPSGYIPKWCRREMKCEGKTSSSRSRKTEEQDLEGQALENYLLQTDEQ